MFGSKARTAQAARDMNRDPVTPAERDAFRRTARRVRKAPGNANNLIGDQNAQHWAERFAGMFPQVYQAGEGVVTDVKGLMLGWFACAIETGRMEADKKS